MPHKVWDLGQLASSGDVAPTPLIPGVEPGGSRAGQPTKPALLIQDCGVQFNDIDLAAGADLRGVNVFLKLSQEPDLNPGLLLHIGGVHILSEEATSVGLAPIVVHNDFHHQGTIWAPAFVGVKFMEQVAVSWDIDVWLKYERIDVPWMDWFMMWDFLDNVVNDTREY